MVVQTSVQRDTWKYLRTFLKKQKSKMDKMSHALTVDVEDAVNQAMRNFFHQDMEPTERVYNNTMRLLDLFSEQAVSGTFFILGEVTRAHPELIKEIERRGHELGIHGDSHKRYHAMPKEEVREEIHRAKAELEDLTGVEVIGHRAPEFSISEENEWVLELLLDEGLKYDSSVYPVKTSRYGWPGFGPEIRWHELSDGRRIAEAPLSVATYCGRTIPVSGGGSFRAFPYGFTRNAVNRVADSRPFIFYMHPYEIDPPPFQDFYMDEVRASSFRNKLQLRMYWFNRNSVYPKLKKLLADNEFTSLKSLISARLSTVL
jgi:polysaccharide deacetylase family protein (PEP-CTERM system associated)